MTEPDGTTLSAPEVCAHAGITYRNLDYWIRCGYVDIDNPESMRAGSGIPRRFTVADAGRFALLQRLIEVGFRVDVAARYVRQLQRGDGRLRLADGIVLEVAVPA